MSEKLRSVGRYAWPVAEMAAASGAYAFVGAAGITARNHRELTHRSIELHPWLQEFFDAEQRTYNVGETTIWAAVHRIHHSIPDASLAPFYKIVRAMRWMEKNPEKAQGVTLPDNFSNLDPFVSSFTREDVVKIGNHADNLIQKRLGDEYQEPQGYTQEELQKLFFPAEPQYFYPEKNHVGPYTQDDVAEILLGDPHSPVRIRPPELNGVRGVLKKNYRLYIEHADLFRAKPRLKEADLQNKDGGNRKASKLDVAVGVGIPAAAVLFRRGKFKPKDFAIAAAAGGAIYGAKIGWMILGGNIVNSYGHAGELTQKALVTAVQKDVLTPVVKKNGSVTTDSTSSGFLGRLLSMATFDEVGGQDEHHKSPDKIAYTSNKGWRAWRDAPWGKTLETLANSKWAPFIKRGRGFELKEGQLRPDIPNPAMQIIHRRRAEQLARAK